VPATSAASQPTPTTAAPAAQAPAASNATTLIYYTGLTGPDGQVMRDIVAKFNKEHADLQVDIQIMPWTDMFAKMVATMAAGNPLDVVIMHPADLTQFVEQDALLPVMDYLTPLGLKLDDYLPQPLKWVTFSGKLVALPLDQHQWNMWLRTDLAEKAGLDVKNPPKDGTQFLDWATKLTTKEGGKIVQSGLEPGFPNPWSLAWTAIYSNGGSYTNEDWTKCTINTPQAVEAVEWVLNVLDTVSNKSGNPSDDFIKGVTAQMQSGPWNIPGLTKSLGKNFASYTTPTLFKTQVVPASAHTLTLPRQKDKGRVASGAQFIKWISDNSILWAESGQIPIKKSILASDDFKKLPYRLPFVDSIPHTVMWSNVRFYGELESPTGARRKNFEMIMSKQISVKDGLAKMEKEVNEVLSRPKQ
jgi:multiple sugar transport system substrate-binding protein